jgi:putative protease
MGPSVELLAPAGNLEKLKTVLHYGADAVFLGGKAFNLRAASHNFGKDELVQAVNYAHNLGKKVYVALNIIAHNREINALPQYIKFLEEARVDAVIVADLGVMGLVKEHSNLPIHISTQASTANWKSVEMLKLMGAKRVVLAREVTLSEITEIKRRVPDVEIEVFVHGAMCMAYSGRCMISQYMSSRDGNRGACSNACRYKYEVVEEKNPGEYFPVVEDESGSYIYNSKDLCTIEFVDRLIEAKVDSFKIEGRMKTSFYGASVTRVYRTAIDSYLAGDYKFNSDWIKELEGVSHRGYTSGFYLGALDKESQNFTGAMLRSKDFVATVVSRQGRKTVLDVRGGKIKPGMLVEYLSRGGIKPFVLPEIRHADSGRVLEEANPGSKVEIETDLEFSPFEIIQKSVPQGTANSSEIASGMTSEAGFEAAEV